MRGNALCAVRMDAHMPDSGLIVNRCNVCSEPLSSPIYRSPGDTSITSLSELRPGATEVFLCTHCDHLQTAPLPDLASYYEADYHILTDSDDEDQIYQVRGGQTIYRVPHQVDTLLEKVTVKSGANILDCGCAKGASAKRLASQRPDLAVHLFDVSHRYVSFWQKFSDSAHWATHALPSEWTARFDLIYSMYVAEHVAQPVDFAASLANCLKPGGVLYWLIPNVETNPADLIVADHVNHFSAWSLAATMQRAGLELVDIDAQSHEGGLIAVARRPAAPAAPCLAHANPGTIPELISTAIDAGTRPQWRSEMQRLSDHWTNLVDRVRQTEAQLAAHQPIAIYGAGFYGTFIASCLAQPERIQCFFDQNPYLAGKSLHGRPIRSPLTLSDEIDTVFVGLNPRRARQIISEISAWQQRPLTLVFLDDGAPAAIEGRKEPIAGDAQPRAA